MFGVPTEFDTGSNESHHKPSKYAARLTQRKEATFNLQTAIRLTEFLILDLALQELKHGRKLWEYYDFAGEVVDALACRMDEDNFNEELGGMVSDMRDLSIETEEGEGTDGGLSDEESDSHVPKHGGEDAELEKKDLVVSTGGTRIRIWEDPNHDNEAIFTLLGRSKTAKECKSTWGVDIIEFLNDLQNLTKPYLPSGHLPVMTEHRRGSEIYHGHPNFRGKGFWRDWTLVDWAQGYGIRPAHIWCFVELENMPRGRERIEFGGVDLADGVYAVVESASYDNVEEDGDQKISDLFVPVTLEVEGIDEDGDVTGRVFYLAEVEAFCGSCILIPDVGGPPNAYFQVKNRSQWSGLFINWLRSTHEEMTFSDEEDENGG